MHVSGGGNKPGGRVAFLMFDEAEPTREASDLAFATYHLVNTLKPVNAYYSLLHEVGPSRGQCRAPPFPPMSKNSNYLYSALPRRDSALPRDQRQP